MAQGTRSELHAMATLVMHDPGPFSHVLTPKQADEAERKGYKVARIPIKPASA